MAGVKRVYEFNICSVNAAFVSEFSLSRVIISYAAPFLFSFFKVIFLSTFHARFFSINEFLRVESVRNKLFNTFAVMTMIVIELRLLLVAT